MKRSETTSEKQMRKIQRIRLSRAVSECGIRKHTFFLHHAFIRVTPELGNCPMMHQIQFCQDDSGRVRSAIFGAENRYPTIISDPETDVEVHLFWIPFGCFQINGIPDENDNIKSVFVVRKPTEMRVFDTSEAAEALEFFGSNHFDPLHDVIVTQTPQTDSERLQAQRAKNRAEKLLFDRVTQW